MLDVAGKGRGLFESEFLYHKNCRVPQPPQDLTYFREPAGRRIRGVFSSWILLLWTRKEEVSRQQAKPEQDKGKNEKASMARNLGTNS